MAVGIEVRHARACRSRSGGRCNCEATFQAHVYDRRTGRRIRKTFPTRSAARLWRQDALVALRQGTLAAPVPLTVGEALEQLLPRMRDGSVLDRTGRPYKPATVRSYKQAAEKYVVPALGHLRVTDLRRRDVQRFVEDLHARGLSPATIANKLDPLRVVCRRALRDELIAVDPMHGLELPAVRRGRDRIEPPERAQALLAALPEGEHPLWSVLLFAGLRRGEARALRWWHVDFDAGVLRVEATWDDHEGEVEPKSDAGRRVVPLAGVVRAALAAHKLRTGRGAGELVFGRTPALPFIPTTVRDRAVRAWREAGLEPLTPHEARHCAASYLIAAGLNAKQLSVYIGHSDIRTTFNRYGHLMPGGEREAAAQLDAFLGGGVRDSRATVDPRFPAVLSGPQRHETPAGAGDRPV